MQPLAIVTMYFIVGIGVGAAIAAGFLMADFIVGIGVGAAIAAGFLMADFAFYGFCWIFCKVDNYLQNRYWRRLQSQSFPVNRIQGFADTDNKAA